MTIRIHKSLHTHIGENNEFVLQVQKSSDPQAALTALRRAADDVAALDGGWESAPGLSPGDTNGPTGVNVFLAPTGPLIAVDGGHTPMELLVTVPRLIARRLEEAGVTSAVLALPKRSETLDQLPRMPRAVVLRLYTPPPLNWIGGLLDRRIPRRWLEEGCTWLTTGLAEDHELWAQLWQMEFSVRASEASQFVRDYGGWLVAGNPPSAAPTRRAKAKGWTQQEIEADRLARIGGRVRVMAAGNTLTLAGGGPDTTDEELLEVYDDLRALARRLAPEAGYGFITPSDHFTLTDAPSLRWSPEAPQSWPHRISDVAVFDAFPAQILGPGHIKRLGGVPAGATELEGGRIELVFGEPTSWLESPLEAGRALLGPCLTTDRGEVQLLTYERYRESMRSTPVDVSLLNGMLWRLLRTPARPIEELLADPGIVSYFKMALRRGSGVGSNPAPPDFVARRAGQQHAGRFLSQLSSLHCPVSLCLYPTPPRDIGVSVQHPDWVFEKAGEWVAAGEPAELWAISDLWRFSIDAHEASRFLPHCHVVALHQDGRVRRGGAPATGLDAAIEMRLTAGRLVGHAQPIGSPAAHAEVLGLIDDLSALARSVAPDLGYAFITTSSWENYKTVVPSDLIDAFVFDAFPYQILGSGHLERLGTIPAAAQPIIGGKVELFIGDPADWLPHRQDAGRRILARCLVTAEEDRAMNRARDVAAALVEAGITQVRDTLAFTGGELDDLRNHPHAVVARCDAAVQSNRRLSVPLEWIDHATGWLTEALVPEATLLAAVEHGMQFALSPSDAGTFLTACAERRELTSGILVGGALGRSVRAVSVTGIGTFPPRLSLAAGGPASTDESLLAFFEDMRSLARRLAAEAMYGYVDFEADFGSFWGDDAIVHGPLSPARPSWSATWSEVVTDAFPYQVLGPGHAARLGSWPPGTSDLENGRGELSIGRPSDWLLGSAHRATLQRTAREILSTLT